MPSGQAQLVTDKKCAVKGAGTVTKHPAQVARRNARERNRVNQLNLGYVQLKRHIPPNSRSKKLSKVETLRQAANYIRYLQRVLLETDGVSGLPNFCPSSATEKQPLAIANSSPNASEEEEGDEENDEDENDSFSNCSEQRNFAAAADNNEQTRSAPPPDYFLHSQQPNNHNWDIEKAYQSTVEISPNSSVASTSTETSPSFFAVGQHQHQQPYIPFSVGQTMSYPNYIERYFPF